MRGKPSGESRHIPISSTTLGCLKAFIRQHSSKNSFTSDCEYNSTKVKETKPFTFSLSRVYSAVHYNRAVERNHAEGGGRAALNSCINKFQCSQGVIIDDLTNIYSSAQLSTRLKLSEILIITG